MLKALVTFGLRAGRSSCSCWLLHRGGGIAFTKLNIEAYPNPAPVILEITAQAAGLSAEEMERYYTIPMEVGLATDARRRQSSARPRSTACRSSASPSSTASTIISPCTQAQISLQQNVNLPNNVQPQIQASSLVGEIYRYQVVGPPALRADQSAHHPGLDRAAPAS